MLSSSLVYSTFFFGWRKGGVVCCCVDVVFWCCLLVLSVIGLLVCWFVGVVLSVVRCRLPIAGN